MPILGTVMGAIAGFLYWRFVGCSSGSCAITASPVNSTIYFSIAGALLGGTFKNTNDTNGRQEAK
jgi:hypothetical protein